MKIIKIFILTDTFDHSIFLFYLTVLSSVYSSLLTQERFETFVYDLKNLMTSLGGNLGLFFWIFLLLYGSCHAEVVFLERNEKQSF
jgi:hypothetical protein